jgi:Glycosyltransferase
MKILTIISKLEMGGIEKTLLSCIPFLKSLGVEMSILCTLGGALDQDFKQLGVRLIDFGSHKKPFKDAKFLKKVLQSNDFDIVHSRYGHTSGGFAKVCSDLGLPFLVSIHNEKAMFRNSWIGRPVLGFLREQYLAYHKNATLKYATKIVGHSRANLNYYDVKDSDLTNTTSNFVLLYNGVDFAKLDVHKDLSDDKSKDLNEFRNKLSKILIHIGSFKEQKNHEFLIEAFDRLKPLEKNYGLILMGVGGLMDKIKDKVKSLGLTEHVFFTGMETNIAPYLKAADLFVFLPYMRVLGMY